MTHHAVGTFDVTLASQEATVPETMQSRIDKQFHGDLTGSSIGMMLGARSQVAGSAGYVAIERFAGSVSGRVGTFVLQHAGTMQAGREALSITVVPDSGTGALTGLSGTMTIDRSSGGHAYRFDYTLSD